MMNPTMKELLRLAQLAAPITQRFVIDDVEEVVSFTTMLTPALAVRLLEHNDGNRKMSPGWVDTLADLMDQGRWKANGEAIIISKTGKVLNGQHRLAAVVKSGKAIMVTITFGVEDDLDTMASIDQGRVRNVADILKIAGVESTPVGRTASNWLASMTEGTPPLKNRPQQADYYLLHNHEIDPWVGWATEVSNLSPLIEHNRRRYRAIGASALVVLAVHVTRNNADPETFQEFINGTINELPFGTMAELSETRRHLLKLMDRRLKHGTPLGRPGGGAAIAPLLAEYGLYIRQYNRYVRDEYIGKVQLTSDAYRYLDELPKVETGGKWS